MHTGVITLPRCLYRLKAIVPLIQSSIWVPGLLMRPAGFPATFARDQD